MYHLSLLSDLCSISSYVKMEISQFFLVIHSGFYECSLYEYRSILNLCSFFLKKERSVSHYLGKHTHTHPHTRTLTHTPHATHTHTPHTRTHHTHTPQRAPGRALTLPQVRLRILSQVTQSLLSLWVFSDSFCSI